MSPGLMQRELALFSLYRLLEAALLALLVFSPWGELLGEVVDPAVAISVSLGYLVASVGLLLHARHARVDHAAHAVVGVAVDIAVAGLVSHAIPEVAPGVAMLLLFNISAASLFVSLRSSLLIAAAAAAALLFERVASLVGGSPFDRPLAETLMFALGFFAAASLTRQLGKQVRDTQALAERRGAEAANMAEINELVIRRMQTGVLLVDGTGQIRLANEAALLLLGDADTPGEDAMHGRTLSQLAPRLALRLADWLRSGSTDDAPLTLREHTDVMPRFVRLLANSDHTLVFLDDTSLVSRRAESLTLATMGRFSAGLAHEIRNPLAAISYATQLLEESEDIRDADRRLLQIIHQQCVRTNGIVESVLSLARRERARPEHVDLVAAAHAFVQDYRMIVADDNAEIRVACDQASLSAVFDPRHLHQVLTALVNNAVRYGRMPGAPARITLRIEPDGDCPTLSVLDRGPGIPDAVASQLFRPFFTTSESGTGLGLYIAHELCRANEARLDYVAVPGGGACFRITLAARQTLLRR
ncbi:HAMP domain-containing sensor histidine kinase [Luteimonas sp BLCC-B24]|uniref:sensor histidine kinase n=1 Tax=Luteimonas sp. BLCC-B24 TaxID=3025317 RepID=UPI00234DBF75|nr:HAMP domain-containing sensor histidine kinase [Luteimonas sp. BLCC-B24]MDC7807760.1 HAMP domain-containing sensor histidine kinase [Luteimonas sp. BLCC-B24]